MFKIKFTNQAESQFLNKAVGTVIAFMQTDLRHPSLKTHKFDSMESPFGGDVFESYAQNKTPGAYRIFWVYGPTRGVITILAIIPHP